MTFKVDFSFVSRVQINSKFKNYTQTNPVLKKHARREPIVLNRAPALYAQLLKGTVNLKVMDLFVLMSWREGDWQSGDGQLAMHHWWQSALHHPTLRLIMMLRVVLADSERWPGPKPVIAAMRDEMQRLIKTGEWPDQQQYEILQFIIQQDAKALAKLAIKQQLSVKELMQSVKLPVHLPIMEEAEEEWLSSWLTLNKEQRQGLRQAISQMLTNKLILARQQQFSVIILNTQNLPKKIEKLKEKVADFPEIVAWFSSCARHIEFRTKFNQEEKQRLNCWIGTGNYESLRKILIEAATIYSIDESSIEKTIKRYIFWKNYQELFEEAWLLLPSNIYNQYEAELNNIKELSGYPYPVVVLKIKDKFVFQAFLGTASQNDLLMTDDIASIEHILTNIIIDYNDLKNLNLILIHDHAFKWQSDLAYILDRHFAIQAQNKMVYYMERSYSYYMEEVAKHDFKEDRKKRENLPRWVENIQRYKKYPESVLKEAALTAIRYNLL